LRALSTTYVDYGLLLLRWADAAARRELGRRIPQVLLLHAGAMDEATLDALLTAYERILHVRWIPLERALADAAYRLERTGAPRARPRHDGWRSIGFQERLVTTAPDPRSPPPPHPVVPIALLDAMCREQPESRAARPEGL
jgi:hypothetical protein